MQVLNHLAVSNSNNGLPLVVSAMRTQNLFFVTTTRPTTDYSQERTIWQKRYRGTSLKNVEASKQRTDISMKLWQLLQPTCSVVVRKEVANAIGL